MTFEDNNSKYLQYVSIIGFNYVPIFNSLHQPLLSHYRTQGINSVLKSSGSNLLGYPLLPLSFEKNPEDIYAQMWVTQYMERFQSLDFRANEKQPLSEDFLTKIVLNPILAQKAVDVRIQYGSLLDRNKEENVKDAVVNVYDSKSFTVSFENALIGPLKNIPTSILSITNPAAFIPKDSAHPDMSDSQNYQLFN